MANCCDQPMIIHHIHEINDGGIQADKAIIGLRELPADEVV